MIRVNSGIHSCQRGKYTLECSFLGNLILHTLDFREVIENRTLRHSGGILQFPFQILSRSKHGGSLTALFIHLIHAYRPVLIVMQGILFIRYRLKSVQDNLFRPSRKPSGIIFFITVTDFIRFSQRPCHGNPGKICGSKVILIFRDDFRTEIHCIITERIHNTLLCRQFLSAYKTLFVICIFRNGL